MGWLGIAVGLFSLCGAVFNWDWYMNARQARFIVAILGRNGARGFYGILGILLMTSGFLAIMDIN